MVTKQFRRRAPIVLLGALAILAAPLVTADAYSPTMGTVYQLPTSQPCLKGRGNCAIYPKAAQLPGGRLVAAFEKSTVAPSSGAATGQTLPIYKSDDSGTTWQHLTDVQAPAYLSSGSAVSKYVSNWTNPYLYTLPQAVGNLSAGTLVMATVVTGEDVYYTEHKAADPNWTPTNDGDRKDVALALYKSTNQGASWSFVNIITTGGWQGGSAGATGTNVAGANTFRQVDPVWEPYLMVYNGQLVAYYSDENDYTTFNATTGALTLDPANSTATDCRCQVIAHRTWNGVSANWNSAVVDVAGTTVPMGGGKNELGGGRPGMPNVVRTTDGKWMLTYEYWGGGANVRFKLASDPLKFFADGDPVGQEISRADGQQAALPFAPGSRGLSWGGSPVLIRTPEGRLLYNASDSGDVWMNPTGNSTGVWTQYQTTMPAGYSRNLTYVQNTGRIAILGNTGTSKIVYADVDFGRSSGTYYKVSNRKTGQVIGTGNHTNDADIGNGNAPDVRLETSGATSNGDTQYWHLVTKANGAATLLNKSGGRAAAIWTGNATVGQGIGQWVDDTTAGLWNLVPTTGGYYKFQSTANPALYLTGSTAGAALTLENATTDGSQEWKLQ